MECALLVWGERKLVAALFSAGGDVQYGGTNCRRWTQSNKHASLNFRFSAFPLNCAGACGRKRLDVDPLVCLKAALPTPSTAGSDRAIRGRKPDIVLYYLLFS